jgi:hypothetical protein
MAMLICGNLAGCFPSPMSGTLVLYGCNLKASHAEEGLWMKVKRRYTSCRRTLAFKNAPR